MNRVPVAIVTTYYAPVLGGAESAAERLAGFLRRRGHPVIVLTTRTSSGVPAREVRDGVEIERLGPIAERSGRGKWVLLPALFRALLRYRSRIAVVCCIDYRGVGLAALAARALTGTPVIFQAQTEGVISAARVREWWARLGGSRDGVAARALTWPVRALYGRADAIGCISRGIERETLDAGVPPEHVYYLPNPVSSQLFDPIDPDERRRVREQIGIPLDAAVAVFVGRLSREKGALELARAWANARPDAYLVMIGPPMTGHAWDVSADVGAVIARERLHARVRLLGGQPSDVVARWLRAADLAVQPSHFEAMGLAAAEAMAAGLPVIASDAGGFRDFVIPGETGLLVPVGDDDALGAAIVRLASDDTLRRRLGANARRVAERFDERVVLGEFAALVDTLAEE